MSWMKKENQYNAAGQKHGLFKEWHSNGKLFYEATYVNGKRHGALKHWFNNGLMLIEAYLEEDVSEGEQINYTS
jgi:antitoxin component YwqK of YwqJK toxin-antitoxin module